MKPYRNFIEWIKQQDKIHDWDEMCPTEMMERAFRAGELLESKKSERFKKALEEIHDSTPRMDHSDLWAIANEALTKSPSVN